MLKPEDLAELYIENRDEIARRAARFERFLKHSSEKRTFAELAFCLLTPQSNAVNCWGAVRNMRKNSILFSSGPEDISEYIVCARFKNKKAAYIAGAREFFTDDGEIRIKGRIESFSDPLKAREWLVKNIKGMGYKEASHFLRNIGKGQNIAILDRHILRNLEGFGIITSIPSSLSVKSYIEIERKMRKFAEIIRIPIDHLDLLLWFRETGRFFK